MVLGSNYIQKRLFYFDVFIMTKFFFNYNTTLSIRIAAACVALYCQVRRKLKRVTILEFTTNSTISFILLKIVTRAAANPISI